MQPSIYGEFSISQKALARYLACAFWQVHSYSNLIHLIEFIPILYTFYFDDISSKEHSFSGTTFDL